MKIYANFIRFEQWHEAGMNQAAPADLQIVTSDGHRIAAHSYVLASASRVLENLVFVAPKHSNSERVVQILGVSSYVVFAFLLLIYSSRTALSCREGKEAIEKYGVQLLLLAHKYRIAWLKRGCEIEIAKQLKPESVVDVLQVARLCDALRLYQMCMSLLSKDFDLVQKSDGWRFIKMNDPRLELEILQFLQYTDQRKKRWRRRREEQYIYEQLSEAIECLEDICTQGCTKTAPVDRQPSSTSTAMCVKFGTCHGLQILINHVATCSKKLSPQGACAHCKRMRKLFRLHSSLCNRSESCKVPLCKQFKLKMQTEGKGDEDDITWRLLVKKIVVARVMSSMSRKKSPEQQNNLGQDHTESIK